MGIVAGLALIACGLPGTVSAQSQNARAPTAAQLRVQIEAFVSARDADSAAQAFQTLVTRYPSTLGQMPDKEIAALLSLLHGSAAGQPRRVALEALFSQGWKLPYNMEPSGIWFQLAQMRLADHDLVGARAVVARITEPALLVRLYCDQRFDSIVTRVNMAEVIRRDAKLEVAQYREAMMHDPRSLVAVLRLVHALLVEGNNLDAIAITQTVNAQVNEAIQKRTAVPYDDEGDLAWVLDQLANALWSSGAFEEGTQVMEAARRLPERGRPNVSQRLNLANMYASLGQSKKALDVVAGIDTGGSGISAYGMLVLQGIYLETALQTGDRAAVGRVLGYLREHETLAPSAVIEDFVAAGATDEADALLRTALADPRQRSDVLMDLQSYAKMPQTPLDKRYQEQLEAWIRRPEVQTEIRKWGHLDRYPVTDRH